MSNVIMKVRCEEKHGVFEREVKLAPFTIERLRYYRDKLSQFPTLFNRFITNADEFLESFISVDGAGQIHANGIVWEVDDVGLIFMTDIYPEFQATGHFTFWDRAFRGREQLIREMLKYSFREFGFRRIIAEVPLYTNPTLKAVERIGFIKEGRMREATWYQGQWYDVNLYSILRREVLEDGTDEA